MDLKYLVTVKEEEKKQLIMLKERIEALHELQLGFETLNLENENSLLEKMKKVEQNTKNEIKQWWQEKIKKYEIKTIEGRECILEYSTNKMFLK